MSQMVAMSQKLKEYEQYIEQTEQRAISPKSLGASLSQPAALHSTASGVRQQQNVTQPSWDDTVVPQNAPAGEEDPSPDLSVDQHGNICYHGPTSAVYHPVSPDATSSNNRSDTEMRTILATTASESKAWEAFAMSNASLRIGVPKEVITGLLNLHWSWIAPMFMWVYRPAFMRKYYAQATTRSYHCIRRYGYWGQVLLGIPVDRHVCALLTFSHQQ